MKTTTKAATKATTTTVPYDIEHTPPRLKDKDKDKDKRKNSNTLMDQTAQDFMQGNIVRKNSNSIIKAKDFKYRHPLYEEKKEEDLTNEEVLNRIIYTFKL
jgi:hypothetical protein